MEAENLQEMLDLRLKNGIRNTILRERHSKKLMSLFSVFRPEERFHRESRVNISTGKIQHEVTPQRKPIPTSICGYADWLYSRRNGIVHGSGGSALFQNDRTQIEKIYGKEPAKTFKIKIGSVTSAANFYKDVAEILR
jgi:hypothetical protein